MLIVLDSAMKYIYFFFLNGNQSSWQSVRSSYQVFPCIISPLTPFFGFPRGGSCDSVYGGRRHGGSQFLVMATMQPQRLRIQVLPWKDRPGRIVDVFPAGLRIQQRRSSWPGKRSTRKLGILLLMAFIPLHWKKRGFLYLQVLQFSQGIFIFYSSSMYFIPKQRVTQFRSLLSVCAYRVRRR